MNAKITTSVAILLAIIALFCSCNRDYKTIKDLQGREVKVPKHVSKVISLSPAAIEIFYATNMQSSLIGRGSFCRTPKSAQSLPIYGGEYDMDTNAILQVCPDVVIATESLPFQSRRFLARNNIPLIIFKSGQKFEDIYDAISLVGKIMNRKDKADSLNNVVKTKLEKITSTNKDKEPTLYFAILSHYPHKMTVNGKSMIGDFIRKAGYKNIAEKNYDMKYETEDLLKQDPQYIFVVQRQYDAFINYPPHKNLSAVKNAKVFPIDEKLLNPLSLLNLEAIKIMHDKKR